MGRNMLARVRRSRNPGLSVPCILSPQRGETGYGWLVATHFPWVKTHG